MDLVAQHNHKMKVFHDIIGCAFDVYNEYHPGLNEYPYQYGLKNLLKRLGYDPRKEHPMPLYLFGDKLEEYYRLDLVLVRPEEGDVIIECKAKKCIIEEHREQLCNYMLLTHCPYGILINFSKSGTVYSEAYKYIEEKHKVEKMDTRYIGIMHEKTIKPWQEYLDKKHTEPICSLPKPEKE